METICRGYISGERKQLHYEALIAKPLKPPCFASWMSNNKHSTPESWNELYINQRIIKCNIWFQILHSGSCPDLFICWNTSKLYQLELLPPSQHLHSPFSKTMLFEGCSFQNANNCDFTSSRKTPWPISLVQPMLRALSALGGEMAQPRRWDKTIGGGTCRSPHRQRLRPGRAAPATRLILILYYSASTVHC